MNEQELNKKLHQRILELVETGIKGVDLSAKMTAYFFDLRRECPDTPEIRSMFGDPMDRIQKLVENALYAGEIVEIEYSVPTMPCRLKSLYFPAGTGFKKIAYADNLEKREFTFKK